MSRPASSAENTHRIIVLFTSDPALPAGQAIRNGLEEGFKSFSEPKFEIYYEYLDSLRFEHPEVEQAMAAFLAVKYAQKPIDVVLAVGPQALLFVVERKSTLFPRAAMAFAAVRADRIKPAILPPRTPGILSQFDPSKSLQLALTLQPGTKHVFVVTGASEFDKGWEKSAREKFGSFSADREFVYLAGLELSELLSKVQNLPPDSVIVYLTVFEDGAGQQFISRDIAEKVAKAANMSSGPGR